jgi:hypothetical protein
MPGPARHAYPVLLGALQGRDVVRLQVGGDHQPHASAAQGETGAGKVAGGPAIGDGGFETGEDQYLLRLVTKTQDGRYILKAANPDYPDYEADEGMQTRARLKAVLAADDLWPGADADGA